MHTPAILVHYWPALVALLVFAGSFVFGMAYTSSHAVSGLGTLLQVNPTLTSPPTWVTVGELVDATFSPKNLFDDTTNLQSSAKEFLAVLPDPGKLTGTMNRVGGTSAQGDAGQAALQASFLNRTRLPYQVVLPPNGTIGQSVGDTFQFNAYVEDFAPDVKTDKKIVSKVTLQITNQITYIAGS